MRFAPIAIVGRGCVLPGALSPAQLWDAVSNARDLVSSVQPGRWRVADQDIFCTAEQPQNDRTWTDRGGYVRGFEGIWNPDGFAVSAAELDGLDPLFHWVLHCAREALAEAGDARRGNVARPRVAAVFGNLGFPIGELTRYAEATWLGSLGREAGSTTPPDPRNRFMSGGAAALLERALGLAPGVYCLDTACASSLYAIEQACRQLHEGRVDLALAGAVNRADDLFLHAGFAALRALSRTGQSRPFHADADGLLPAEGAGFVALERLDDARRNGRHIYGVIRGVGLSNDGRGRGMLAPSEDGQRRAITQAYARAGLDPREVTLLECHATGTTLGDATELRSSASVFAGGDEIAIGSLKSNIGHAITAAGVAGLIKVTESLAHDQRAPTLHTERQNPALAETPFRLIRTLERWSRRDPETPRIAGISAFGFGGNNAHLIVSDDGPSLTGGEPIQAPTCALAVVGIGATIGRASGIAAIEGVLLSGQSLVHEGAAAASTAELDLTGLSFPPNDLRRALPQQLLLLAAAREATAGVRGLSSGRSEPPAGDRMGVFVGMEPDPEICRYGARGRLETRLREHGGDPVREQAWLQTARDHISPPLDASAVLGTMPNIPANRVNVQLDLGGPSWTVSAGEASGLVALELARAALSRRELDLAVVGAVDLSCQDIHRAALQAIEGHSEPPGDAAVILVLRRLDDARASGDAILAVLEPAGTSDRGVQLEPIDLRARLGRCHAAGALRDVAAAVITGRRGALPDARAWPGDMRLSVSGDGLSLRPIAAGSEMINFAAADPTQLDAALAQGRIGGEGSSRAVILANGPAQLDARVARARRHLQDGTPTGPGVFVRRTPITGELAFVFGGAGAAYGGMGVELLAALPELGRSVATASPALASYFEHPWPTDEADVPPLQRLWASSFLAQVHARLATERLGLRPAAAIGYSSGESNALFAAGIWTDPDAMVAACRDSGVFDREIGGELQAVARAWGAQAPRWQTWTVLAPVHALAAAVAPEAHAHLSIIHHDDEGVIAGDPDACARVRERVGGRWLRLHYDLAVHVPELGQIAERWLELHRWPVGTSTNQPVGRGDNPRIYSGALARAYTPSTEACAAAILGQADRPLDFRKVVEQAYADGVRVFVELGPRAACSRWIRKILGAREAVVVGFDRKGGGLEGVREAVAALEAAGVACRGRELLAALAPPMRQSGPRLQVPAHPEPIKLTPRAGTPSPMNAPSHSSHPSHPSMQTMARAPELPPVDAVAPALTGVAMPSMPSMPASAPRPTAPSPATASSPTNSNPIAAAVAAQLAELGRAQREFIDRQADLHRQFLAVHERSVATLAAVARGGSVAMPMPAVSPTLPAPAMRPAPAPAMRPAPAPAITPAPAPQRPAIQEQPRPPAPVIERPPTPALHHPPTPAAPTRKPTIGPRPPIGPSFTRAQLEIHASGRISEIFGPAFANQDNFHRQVRMPKPPLLLADRVTGLDAEPTSMKLGTIWTQTDVRADSWYVHDGRMPAGIMIEAGQADLMLISYLGIDAFNKSERVYRLLGCTLTYHGSLPAVGETLTYEIHLDGHAKTGATRLMFFHYDCHIGDRLCLSVRGGQAGFFTDEELADSEGCLWRPETQDIVEIGPNAGHLDPPAVACERSSFSEAQVAAFADGRLWDCFGPQDKSRSVWDRARPHTRTPSIAIGNMMLMDRVEQFDVRGGPWGRGYLAAELDIRPDSWFFDGHFFNDPCMPGTLMFEGCFQAMAFYLAALGYTLPRDGWRFEPMPERAFTLSCRGQVQPHSKLLRCEIFVEEIIAGPIPTIFADVLGTVDGLKAFHGRRVGLRLVPAWPLDEGHPLLENYTGEPRPVARIGALELGLPSMLACAQGRPSTAFGPNYARFDGPNSVARLPNPPYLFISRVLTVDGEFGAMQSGVRVEVEYDIPPSVWYLAENGCRVMPFAVLLEAALQPCGWLASYMGCALSSEIPLKFRNLDGTGTVHAEVLPGAGSLRTRVRNKQLSRTASMIIVGFEVECRQGDTLVYSLDTVFGFFPASAFEDQAGLPTSPAQRLAITSASTFQRQLGGEQSPTRAQLARPGLLMLDRITAFDPEGGAAKLGFARAEKDVNPGEWFFAAHFFQDPVQPGSLGIEAMIQLLQWTMLELGMDAGMAAPRFEAIALNMPLTWKYRGQVVPTDGVISTTLELTARGRDERGAWATGDLSLWVDGKRIYEGNGLGMRIVDGAVPGARGALDIARVQSFWRGWLEHGGWPGEDLHLGLVDRFVGRIEIEDPAGFAAVAERGAVFLANHQVAIESLAFSIVVSALLRRPTLAVAKAEHEHSWVGQLVDLCVDFPGIRNPELLTFFSRGDAASAQQVLGVLATALREHGRSVLVHIEGTRSLDCATPVQKMSGSFIDLALALDVPVIPVRFIGALPVEPLAERLEFPLGMARQDIWIGRPLAPASLGKLPYGERKRVVIEAINNLGVRSRDERPNPGNPAFAARVESWQAARGIKHEHATLHEVLRDRPDPCDSIRTLLGATDVAELERDQTPEGRWLARLGRWLLG
jgi:acyl transferase domain-containing protein/3-hydroxymyristoyl/3-hydroxydecanoyl-(acyl carrier protein) dehydratase/1-acyl-sn-glycerol-3-phosphate acyltransferase